MSLSSYTKSLTTNLYFIDATISFEQQTYTVYETDEKVESVLVLSNPSSSVITLEIYNIDGSAAGKQ